MIETLPERVNANAWLVHRGRFVDTQCLIDVGETPWLMQIQAGRITSLQRGPFVMPRWTFALRASSETWSAFWEEHPAPGFHDLMAMIKSRALRLEGDQHPFMANLLYFKEVLAAARQGAAPDPLTSQSASGMSQSASGTSQSASGTSQSASGTSQSASGTSQSISDRAAHGGVEATVRRSRPPEFEPVVGGYLNLELLGAPHRLYVEQAGQGIPLLCLHTAGADTRQYRALMNDPEILERFRVLAFDMPWHGKSSPPAGWQQSEYRLTSADYVAMILSVCDALALDKPVVMGCSIGGRIVLNLALECPDRFRALIGLQSGAHVDPYYDLQWLHRPDVHGGEVCAGIISGLVGPSAPEADRAETLWHYMQGGPGVFKGDLYFYKIDGDLRGRVQEIDTTRCPLYLLSGEYDYSCTPDDTRDLARRIAGANATIMPGIGHFPMSEDPEGFLTHLRPVLEQID